MRVGALLVSADRIVLPARYRAASGLDDVRWCVRSGHVAPIITAPFIKCRFVGMTNLSSGRWLPVDPYNSL